MVVIIILAVSGGYLALASSGLLSKLSSTTVPEKVSIISFLKAWAWEWEKTPV
ncbi:MAG: hypothetical protein JRN20_23490 [Nitrososphaerota archaeon]|nr:hypothetical protein [Nitrososphaerota archaeon]